MLDGPRRRHKARRRVLGVHARLDRVPSKVSLSCVNPSGSPCATRICHSTRSSPVIHSVTGCSTWSRVFISRKKVPLGIGENSTVPAPT